MHTWASDRQPRAISAPDGAHWKPRQGCGGPGPSPPRGRPTAAATRPGQRRQEPVLAPSVNGPSAKTPARGHTLLQGCPVPHSPAPRALYPVSHCGQRQSLGLSPSASAQEVTPAPGTAGQAVSRTPRAKAGQGSLFPGRGRCPGTQGTRSSDSDRRQPLRCPTAAFWETSVSAGDQRHECGGGGRVPESPQFTTAPSPCTWRPGPRGLSGRALAGVGASRRWCWASRVAPAGAATSAGQGAVPRAGAQRGVTPGMAGLEGHQLGHSSHVRPSPSSCPLEPRLSSSLSAVFVEEFRME